MLEEEAAEDVVVLDVRRKCNWTSYFVIGSASTGKQVEGIARALVRRLKEKRKKLLYNIDDSSSDWFAIDLGEFVVHLMVPESACYCVYLFFLPTAFVARKRYDLETLWTKRPELSRAEMFRQLLAEDPEEENEDNYLPDDGQSHGLTPEEAGLTPEEIAEIESMDDEADLKVRSG